MFPLPFYPFFTRSRLRASCWIWAGEQTLFRPLIMSRILRPACVKMWPTRPSGRTSMCAQAWVQRPARHVRAQCPLRASKRGSKPGEFDAYYSHWISIIALVSNVVSKFSQACNQSELIGHYVPIQILSYPLPHPICLPPRTPIKHSVVKYLGYSFREQCPRYHVPYGGSWTFSVCTMLSLNFKAASLIDTHSPALAFFAIFQRNCFNISLKTWFILGDPSRW